MNPAPSLAIRAESLVKNYRTDWRSHPWRALDGVSLAVPRGTVCGLIGSNGSGKTTTLKVLAGLVRADSGRCEIDGGSVAAAQAAGKVGFLSETAGWSAHLSGREFLRGLALVSGLAREPAEEAVVTALRRVGLDGAADRRLGGYSKGMRQKLGLAQAVLGDPAVVLLDEPAAGLDPRASAQLGGVIERLRARGRTVLLTSHFLPQAAEWCDRIVLLERGRVLFAGDRAAVAAAGGLDRLYLERTLG